MSLALAAVVGLAFAGKTLSDNSDEYSAKSEILTTRPERATMNFQEENPTIRANRWPTKTEIPNFGDLSKIGNRSVFGQPVYNLDDRQNVSNKMHNLNPNPWVRVGPGLGVQASTPAYGGYQQLFRVLPTNTNEYRLTQLPGRIQAPPASIVPGQEARVRVDKNRPEKDYFRAPGKGSATDRAPESRGKYVKGERWTKKDVATFRSDGLEKGGPRHILQSGYIVSGNQSLDRCDRRAKGNRGGNPGNMNVRADPLGAHGMATQVRVDSYGSKAPPVGTFMVPNGYNRIGIQEANQYKDHENTRSLSIAKKQLSGNPFNHPIN